MSGFRGGSHHRRSLSDPSLIQLVADYLCQNSHQSHINLEHMGDHIRRKSFRYSRMKQAVFKDQLRKAYTMYSESSTATVDDLSGDNFELDNTPLTDQTLKDMEGYPTESDSEDDSDIEIQESPVILGDNGVGQMKNLYASNMNQNSHIDASKNNNGKPTLEQDHSSTVANKKQSGAQDSKEKGDCVSADSSTDFSVMSDVSKGKLVPASDNLHPDDEGDGESDLEIIEEVPNMGMGGFLNGDLRTPSTSVRPANLIAAAAKNNVTVVTFPSVGNVISSNMKDTQSRKLDQPGRGIKRKPLNDGVQSGINEDLGRKRPKKEIAIIQDTGYKLRDFAGSDKAVEEICKLLMHLKHPEIYQTLGVTPPRGFLLHGPPGTGKTLLANAIAGELEMPMLKVAGTELVSGISGESESNIRDLFNQAVAVAPCIIFIDEIDSVTPRRENVNKEMERRIVAQLLSCIDDLGNKEKGNQVLLIGATNRIEAIDTALRRAGRFDREICLGIPDEKSREKILTVICRDLRLESDFKLTALARLTPGYVGADLQALLREAAVQAVNRKLLCEPLSKNQPENITTEKMEVDESGVVGDEDKTESKSVEAAGQEQLDNQHKEQTSDQTQQPDSFPKTSDSQSDPMRWIKDNAPLTSNELKDLFITMKDFELALKNVQPSSKREGFATVPDTTWEDIGALQNIRDELQVSILGPVKHAEAFKMLGLTTPAGVLLCGPPGCGKTLLAKAVANEAGINFISVKGPELLNMYVGESERAVRQCFLRARNSSPCVIFFDELDALCPRRSDVADSGSSGRIVNQLLTEMDGMESRQGVFVMAATNRPDIIDPAVLRPGRLDKILFVNLPAPKDRLEILKAITKNSTTPLLADDVDLEQISSCPECENYTGADLSALVREASIAAFRELVLNPEKEKTVEPNELKVYQRHFHVAFTKTKPSVGPEDRKKYNEMAAKYSSIH